MGDKNTITITVRDQDIEYTVDVDDFMTKLKKRTLNQDELQKFILLLMKVNNLKIKN